MDRPKARSPLCSKRFHSLFAAACCDAICAPCTEAAGVLGGQLGRPACSHRLPARDLAVNPLDLMPNLCILSLMRLRSIIPLLMLMLAIMSPDVRGGGSYMPQDSCVHVHQHGGMIHLHASTDPHPHRTHALQGCCAESCDDEKHEDCCGDHDHHPEQLGHALFSRGPELPTSNACVLEIPIIDALIESPCRALIRWLPLRQRPPDHLGHLCTFVMNN